MITLARMRIITLTLSVRLNITPTGQVRPTNPTSSVGWLGRWSPAQMISLLIDLDSRLNISSDYCHSNITLVLYNHLTFYVQICRWLIVIISQYCVSLTFMCMHQFRQMQVSQDGRSLLIPTVDGVHMEEGASLVKTSPKWIVLEPMLLAGLPRAL